MRARGIFGLFCALACGAVASCRGGPDPVAADGADAGRSDSDSDSDGEATPQCWPAEPINKGCYPNCPPPDYASAGGCGTTCPKLFADAGHPSSIAAVTGAVAWSEWPDHVVFRDGDGGAHAVSGDGYVLAMNASDVYWGGTALWSCPVSGCRSPEGPTRINPEPPDELAGTTRIIALVLDATSVYYADYRKGTIEVCPLAGCGGASKTLAAVVTASLSRYGEDLYWTSNGAVEACAVTDCASTRRTIADAKSRADYVAVDDSGVYVRTPLACDPPAPGRISRLSAGGAAIIAETSESSSFALDASFIYFIDGGWVVRCPKSGCAAGRTSITRGLRDAPTELAVDATHVYWSEFFGDVVGIATR